jgi:hypothetical protein
MIVHHAMEQTLMPSSIITLFPKESWWICGGHLLWKIDALLFLGLRIILTNSPFELANKPVDCLIINVLLVMVIKIGSI